MKDVAKSLGCLYGSETPGVVNDDCGGGILQLNTLQKGRIIFQWMGYMRCQIILSWYTIPLTRFLKPLRQSTTSFVLLRAPQVGLVPELLPLLS
ncbi:hypothetical protein CSKR_100639 [Clonorchis sinensis]|uniref:Uncharacterized protein n=1 Tax=Clonorchis sinensis TaxID=79923 RepID=A0A419PFY9_CLOSI|nr:hypothetical protein CSKR_100639 [Clonorchis sinensis]